MGKGVTYTTTQFILLLYYSGIGPGNAGSGVKGLSLDKFLLHTLCHISLIGSASWQGKTGIKGDAVVRDGRRVCRYRPATVEALISSVAEVHGSANVAVKVDQARLTTACTPCQHTHTPITRY